VVTSAAASAASTAALRMLFLRIARAGLAARTLGALLAFLVVPEKDFLVLLLILLDGAVVVIVLDHRGLRRRLEDDGVVGAGFRRRLLDLMLGVGHGVVDDHG